MPPSASVVFSVSPETPIETVVAAPSGPVNVTFSPLREIVVFSLPPFTDMAETRPLEVS